MSTGAAAVPATIRLSTWAAAAMLAPSLVLIAVLVAVPLADMAWASLHRASFGMLQPGVTFANYTEILSSTLYGEIFLTTFLAALAVTGLCIVLGYPVAVHLVRSSERWRALLYFLIAAPLLINTVVRTYGWLLILGRRGLINTVLMDAGLLTTPIAMSGNLAGMIIGATQVFLPFMILSIATSLQAIDRRLLESSDVLGASPLQTFFRVLLPLSMPGVIAGSILVFSLMLGAFVTPLILGGTSLKYLSVAVYTDALVLFNLPRATALSLLLLVAVTVVYLVQSRLTRRYARAA